VRNEIYYTSIYTQKIYVGPTFTPDDILNAITGKLHQNYPNPFNPTTTISFEFPINIENPVIEIYNLKGQKIKTFHVILSGVEGQTSVVWNGTDENNQPVSSGIYFYKF